MTKSESMRTFVAALACRWCEPPLSSVFRMLLIAGACVLGSIQTSSQVMLSPVGVNSDLGAYDETTAFEKMIDQSGIQTPFASGSTRFDEYFTVPGGAFAMNGGGNNWQSEVTFELPLQGYIDFDLGAVYRVRKLAIWNVSLKEVTISLRDEPAAPERAVGNFTLTNHWNFPFSYPADILDFGGEFEGRYLRINVHSVYTSSPQDTFGYANAGEVVLSVASDSGPSVPPTISVATSATGDVVVTFTGGLQTASDIQTGFTDVAGNPKSTYTIGKSSLSGRQFFRARSD